MNAGTCKPISISPKASWIIYSLLVVIRVSACFFKSYIHPDEFFQGGQELFYGHQGQELPWEFQQQHALRSIVPPTFMTCFPLWIFSFTRIPLDGWLVLVIPRLFMCVLSFLSFDRVLWKVCCTEYWQNNKCSIVPIEVLILSSSWCVIVFGCRPFTNSLEAMILASLIDLCCFSYPKEEDNRKKIIWHWLKIGAICSVGLFTRFTFCFFAVPIVLSLVMHKILPVPAVIINDMTMTRMQPNTDIALKLSSIIFGFIMISSIFVLCDSYYYHALTDMSIAPILAPLNAMRYNSKVRNLSEHGLHPRITHALVNMPMLFGPLAILFFWDSTCKFTSSIRMLSCPVSSENIRRNVCCLSYSIILSLVILSAAPHQEARFLFPMILPLVLLCAKSATIAGRNILFIWIMMNSILLVFFGIFHQAGVVTSLLHTNSMISNDTDYCGSMIYYHTYMPPTYLATATVKIIDLKGSSLDTLVQSIRTQLKCNDNDDSNEERGREVIVVSPPSALQSPSALYCHYQLKDTIMVEEFMFQRSERYFHLSTEHFPVWCGNIPEFWAALELVRYTVQCSV